MTSNTSAIDMILREQEQVKAERDAAMAKVAELNGALFCLKRLLDKLGALPLEEPEAPRLAPLEAETPNPELVGRAAHLLGLPTIRSTMRDVVAGFEGRPFTSQEARDEVIRRLPHAKVDSIRAEFSTAKTRGEIAVIGEDRFVEAPPDGTHLNGKRIHAAVAATTSETTSG